MRSGTLFAYFVTFTASFCMMVIELVAGRILAPYIGQHLYSWTSIIGVCLAGISVGAWLGGWLADKIPRRGTLGWLLLFAGLFSLAIPLLTDQICNTEFFYLIKKNSVSLMLRIVIYTSAIFLPATLVLGMISPMVIKLIIRDLSNAGSVVGRIYSFSTVGSILGTFATGFFLIEEFGTRTLLYSVGGLLIIIAPLAGGLFGSGAKYVGGSVAGLVLVVIAASMIFPGNYRQIRDDVMHVISHPLYFHYSAPANYFDEEDDGNPAPKKDPNAKSFFARLKEGHFTYPHHSAEYYKESSYYTLRVIQREHNDSVTGEMRPLNDLVLDNLIHSHSDLTDPFFLEYDYLRVYEELVGWQLQRKGSTKHRQLFIGGGGYTLQRLFHARYKDSHIDVAEIDPAVTNVAYKYMGAPRNDPRLVTTNEDGRLYVLDKQKTGEKYEFIFGDAFNDLSVPFHLTTLEFDQQMKNLLSSNGLVMSLVIDNVGQGLFLPSFIATMRKAFGDENVVLILIDEIHGRKDRDEYLKDHKLDQYIPRLSKETLEDVIKDWDQKKFAEEIKYLKRKKLDDSSPYLKPLDLDYVGHSTVIVVGSATKQDWDDFQKYLDAQNAQAQKDNSNKRTVSNVIRPSVLNEYLTSRTREANLYEKLTKGGNRHPWAPVVLTDDYAPVDNLIAPVFEQRFGFKKRTQSDKKENEDDLVDQLLKDIKEADTKK